MDIIEKTFDAKVDNLHEVLGFVEEQLETHEASMKVINIMSISLEEMYANVCMYAYVDRQTVGNCTIKISFENDIATVVLMDDGIEFNPLAKQDPDIHLAAEERDIGGLGNLKKDIEDSATLYKNLSF